VYKRQILHIALELALAGRLALPSKLLNHRQRALVRRLIL
jgi:hypothetical protein